MISRRRPAAVVVVVVLAVAVSSCSTIRPPSVTLKGVEFAGISTDGIDFTLLTDVTNPNGFSATVSQLDYRVFIDDVELAHGETREGVHMGSGETAEVRIPFTLTWEGAKTGLKEFLDGRDHEWRLEGTAGVRKDAGSRGRTFRFVETGSFSGPSGADFDLEL